MGGRASECVSDSTAKASPSLPTRNVSTSERVPLAGKKKKKKKKKKKERAIIIMPANGVTAKAAVEKGEARVGGSAMVKLSSQYLLSFPSHLLRSIEDCFNYGSQK